MTPDEIVAAAVRLAEFEAVVAQGWLNGKFHNPAPSAETAARRAAELEREFWVALLQRGPASWDCYCGDFEPEDHTEDMCFPCAARQAIRARGEGS